MRKDVRDPKDANQEQAGPLAAKLKRVSAEIERKALTVRQAPRRAAKKARGQ